MLVKIHLKTACGCTKTFFEPNAPQVYHGYRVPVLVTKRDQFSEPSLERSVTWKTRVFELIKITCKSRRRIEVWYEEVVYE